MIISKFGGASPRRRTISVLLPAIWVIAVVLSVCPAAAHPSNAAKNVLIIRGESPELPASRLLIDGIESALRTSQTDPHEFYLEAIDTPALSSPETYEARLANLLEEKYRDTPLDLVVAFTEPAVRFVLRERANLFPKAPLLLGLVDRRLIDPSTLPSEAALVSVDLETQYLSTGIECLELSNGKNVIERRSGGRFIANLPPHVFAFHQPAHTKRIGQA